MPKRAGPKRPAPKTCFIYTRVSSKEQQEHGFSLDAQMDAQRLYAARNNLKVLAEFIDAESSRTTGRTEFTRMLQAAAKKPGIAIVVEKTDRLYRNFVDYVKVDALDVELHFTKEGMVINDDSRSSDKFIHSIKVCMAKTFSDNLSEEVYKGMMEKVRQGGYPSLAPLGYLNAMDGTRKIIVPDPERALLVQRLFEGYAANRFAITGAATYARSIGLTSRAGKPLARSSIARMLENPCYAGMVCWDGETHFGTHKPLITLGLFTQVQETMKGRTRCTGFGGKEFAYKGILTCGHCGCAMTAEEHKGGKYIYYRCTGGRDPKCPGKKTIAESVLTDYFADLLSGLELTPASHRWLVKAMEDCADMQKREVDDAIDRLRKDEKRIREEMTQIYLDKIRGALPAALYADVQARLQKELGEVDQQLRGIKSAEVKSFDQGLAILEVARTAGIRFKLADSSIRRDILKDVVSNCTYKDGNVQVQLLEPFDSLLKANQNPVENGVSEMWYSTLDAFTRLAVA